MWGVLKILELVIEEVSNRYSPFLSIAEAISLIVGKVKEDKKPDKKEPLRKIVNSEPEIPPLPKKQSKSVEKKEEKKKDLEEDLQEEIDEDTVTVNVDYSHEEELLINEIYGSKPVDYLDLFYGGITSNVSSNPYATEEHQLSTGILSDAENTIISDREAEKTIIKIQYAAALKNFEGVNFKEREKFSKWVKFNPVLMRMFESVHGITNEVNYDQLF